MSKRLSGLLICGVLSCFASVPYAAPANEPVQCPENLVQAAKDQVEGLIEGGAAAAEATGKVILNNPGCVCQVAALKEGETPEPEAADLLALLPDPDCAIGVAVAAALTDPDSAEDIIARASEAVPSHAAAIAAAVTEALAPAADALVETGGLAQGLPGGTTTTAGTGGTASTF